MISMIIMLIVFLGFASIISYSVMTMNQNLIVTGNIEATNNELKTIKQVIISNAKPLESSTDYSLPYGIDDYSNDRHTLPTHLNIPLKNVDGFFYQYCPYGIVDGTSKIDPVTQNGGNTYNVLTKEINSIKYVTHSEVAHSLTGAPEVLAFILSANSNQELDCGDVLYDENIETFYANNSKVVAITKAEVQQYNRLNNLSGFTESIFVNSLNYDDIFNMIENDISNKSYEITFSNNISTNNSYSFNRTPNKKTTLSFDFNGYELRGNSSFDLNNIELYMQGSATNFDGVNSFSAITLTDSNAYFESVVLGSLNSINSDIVLDNSSAETGSSQSHFEFFNSQLNIRNDSFFHSNNNSLNEDAVVEFKKSNIIIDEGATLSIIKKNGTFNSLIKLSDSDLAIFGTVTENNSESTRASDSSIFIDSSSELYMNGGTLEFKGNLSSNGDAIVVKGKIITEDSANIIRATNASNLENLIFVEGGELSLDGVLVGQGSNIDNVTIKEDDSTSNNRGIAKLSGSGTIYQGTNGCFEGETFKKSYTVDNTYRTENSGSDSEVNNLSDYTCN